MLLEVSGITTAYGGLTAIEDISIGVHAGEIVTVAGANGAGKSTLLKSISCMERVKAGTVTFAGERIEALPAHLVTARGLAYVPESKRLFPRLSVADNLRLGSYLFRKAEDRDSQLDIVFRLFPRLKERLHQRAGTLSGGEQQMLAISRALQTRPRLLMLDEPSQGIMPKLVDEIFEAIRDVRETGVTILLVEQRLTESLAISDRAYVLQTGRVIMDGPAAEIAANADVRRAYLGM